MEMFGGGAVRLVIQDQIDLALTVKVDGFRTMVTGTSETECRQKVCQFLLRLLVHSKFNKFETVVRRWRGQRGGRHGGACLGFEQDQRS